MTGRRSILDVDHTDFRCAICQRDICMRWNGPGRDEIIAPLCTGCERWHAEGIGKPFGGSLRDRREVRRGIALANALHDEAARQRWSEGFHAAA